MKELYRFKVVVGDREAEVVLKKPGRRELEDFAVIYNAEEGKALSKGLLPYSILRKSIINSGGFWSDVEVSYADTLLRKMNETLNEIQLLTIENKDTSELKSSLEVLTKEFQEYKRPESELYAKSAEYEAKKNTIVNIVLRSTFIKDGEEYKFVFPGSTHESRLECSYDYFDDETKLLEQKIFNKAFMCFYHAIENKETNKDVFDLLIKESDES